MDNINYYTPSSTSITVLVLVPRLSTVATSTSCSMRVVSVSIVHLTMR